jgi:hypothetical protein
MLLVNNVFVSNIKEMHVTVDVKSEENEPSMPLADVIDAFEDAKREFDTAFSVLRMHERSVEAARKRAEARNLDLERLVERQVFPQSAAAWDNARAQLERDLGLSKGPGKFAKANRLQKYAWGPDAYRDAGNALPTGSIFETRGVPVKGPDNKTVEVGREAKDAGWYKPESMADAYARLTSADFDTSERRAQEYDRPPLRDAGIVGKGWRVDLPTRWTKLERGMVVQLGCIDGQHPPLPSNQPLVVVDISKDRTMAALAYGATERWVPLDGRIRPWQ